MSGQHSPLVIESKPQFTYMLIVEVTFEAAHRLEGYDGPCSKVHGHTWRVELVVSRDWLYDCGELAGMAYDGVMLRRWLADAVADMDHADLNKIVPDGRRPTCEVIGEIILERLLFQHDIRPADVYVRIQEGEGLAVMVRKL